MSTMEVKNMRLVMFLRLKSMLKHFKNKKYAVVGTDIEKPVSKESIAIWKSRNMTPYEKGIAYVKYEGNERVYDYPLFFICPDKTTS
jgi:hypothetical protein